MSNMDASKKSPDDSTSELLVALALENYSLGRTKEDEPFAVERGGPNIARMLRGGDLLRSTLAREFRRKFRQTPSGSAITDAMNVLVGEALDLEPQDVALRVAKHLDGIVIDLGRTDGKVVFVQPSGWKVLDRSPVLFRRTGLTGELPLPVRGGTLDELRGLLNISGEYWECLRGWMVASLFPDIPHPILMLGGLQGTGKSTAMRLVGGLIDPSPVLSQAEPSNAEQWAVMASSRWVIWLDNISHIAPWFSDTLCKSVTGDGCVRRKLYTDKDIAVMSYRRVVGITSIDAGILRGDLADRLLLVELQPLRDNNRRSETEIMAVYEPLKSQLFGALLDVAAEVLRKLPSVRLTEMPRMADFARILAAIDAGTGSALRTYLDQDELLASNVIDSDPVAGAIVTLVTTCGRWSGTADALLKALSPPDGLSKEWPRNAKSMGSRLKRLVPALKIVGIHVDFERTPDKARKRIYTMTKASELPPKENSEANIAQDVATPLVSEISDVSDDSDTLDDSDTTDVSDVSDDFSPHLLDYPTETPTETFEQQSMF